MKERDKNLFPMKKKLQKSRMRITFVSSTNKVTTTSFYTHTVFPDTNKSTFCLSAQFGGEWCFGDGAEKHLWGNYGQLHLGCSNVLGRTTLLSGKWNL